MDPVLPLPARALEKDAPVVHDKLNDQEAMIANALVWGYAFGQKSFLNFCVDQLTEIEWNHTCWDELVLDLGVKQTVWALVMAHTQEREQFDDIVRGKGRGLVFALHGPAGVGKTLTAECVAESLRMPLMVVSSGELGPSIRDLDTNLAFFMDLAATWRAVLLIDEADVFLERRSHSDLHRSAMVSVLLRMLEYYRGIMFLTTNRVKAIDGGFSSRIHVPIRYTDLTVDSRRQIWRNMCKRVPGGVHISDAGYDVLAKHEMNGRQIKNAVKAAESLAAFDGVKLDLEKVLKITPLQDVFGKDLDTWSEIDYTAPGQAHKHDEVRNMYN